MKAKPKNNTNRKPHCIEVVLVISIVFVVTVVILALVGPAVGEIHSNLAPQLNLGQ